MNRSPMGVYAIRNRMTGQQYVGVSINIPARWIQHVTELSGGRHANRRLQASWDIHGAAAFSFDIIECVEREEDLAGAELRWISQEGQRSGENLLNVSHRRRPNHALRSHAPEGYATLSQAMKALGVSYAVLTGHLLRLGIETSDSPFYHRTRLVQLDDVERIRSVLTEIGYYQVVAA